MLDRIAEWPKPAAVHIVTLPVTIETNPGEFIKAGRYVADNLLCAQLINLCGDGEMEPMQEYRPFDESQDWNGKKILLLRAGGFGDIINLTPSCREIKCRWPNCEVHVASMKLYSCVLENLPYISGRVEYPVSLDALHAYDAWVFFENAVEKNPRAEKLHLVDLFAEIIGLTKQPWIGVSGMGWLGTDWTDHKKPEYVVTKEEIGWANVQYPRKPGLRRLCIQPIASGQCRVYDFAKMGHVIDAFAAKKTWEIYLLGAHESIRMQETPLVHNMTVNPMTFRQSVAILNGSDCLLANDSSLIHVAGALDIPAVGLYGPFPWKLRTAYYTSVLSISGKGRCSPCFYHESLGKLTRDPFPKNCPSRAKNHCEVLASIPEKTIIAKIEKHARPLKLQAL